jgi:hypothetical protein
VIGRGDVRTPRLVVDRAAARARRDDVAGRPRLVLALVREQCPVVHIADGVQPVTAAHAHRVVDVEPRAGLEAEVSSPTSPVRGTRPSRRGSRRRDRSVASVTVTVPVAASRAPPRLGAQRTSTPAARRPADRVAANGSIPRAGRSARSS